MPTDRAHPAPIGCRFRIAAEQLAACAATRTAITDYTEIAALSLLLAEAADLHTEQRGGTLLAPGATGRHILASARQAAQVAA